MIDRGKVIKGLECHADRTNLSCNIAKCPYYELDFCGVRLSQDALALLKEQENEEERILKIVWDVLHGCVSTDTVEDQDWVYEQIRNRAHPMY